MENVVNFFISGGEKLYYSTKMFDHPRVDEYFVFTGGKKGKIVNVQWVFTKDQPTRINLYCEIDN